MANYLLETSLILSLTLVLGHCSGLQSQRCSVLHLLNVVPLRRYSESNVWDRGLDVTPAGHLATEQINSRSDILPGYTLELIDVDSEPCGVNVISKGIANVYRELVNSSRCIVGVVGLYCSQVTDIISPIVSHPNVGRYVQIAASTSPPRHTNLEETGLFHIVGLSSVFNHATLSLMRTLNWSRISIVHHTLGFFVDSIANDFVRRIGSLPDMKLLTRIPIADSDLSTISETFKTINDHEARISYWSVSYTESAHLLCEAYNRGFYWPGYVYILREPTLDSILGVQTSCTKKELMIALEGALLLQYRLFTNNDTILESGVSYSEYWQMYNDKLQEFANVKNVKLSGTTYANALYDQVWAFGLAINNIIKSQNVSFESHVMGNVASANTNTSQLLQSELKQLSFQGASRRIRFNSNQESSSYVRILQVHNGTTKLVGIFNPSDGNVTHLTINDTPKDTFDTKRDLLPLWLGVCILLAQVALLCLISANLILILWWRKDKDIKAISPILSTLMMVGCYLLCVRPIILVVYRIAKLNESDVEPLCILEHCTWVGFELILATLFFKILRIYHIFRENQMTMMGDFWYDGCLFIYTIVVCVGKAILLSFWYSLDRVHPQFVHVYVRTPVAQYVATLRCTSNNADIWTVVTLLYSGVLLLMTVILAIMTRHVKSTYKDTKKVNLFIFLVLLSLAIVIPLWLVFHFQGRETDASVVKWLAYFSVPMLCQVCLFVPKTLPLILKKILPSGTKTFRQPGTCSHYTTI